MEYCFEITPHFTFINFPILVAIELIVFFISRRNSTQLSLDNSFFLSFPCFHVGRCSACYLPNGRSFVGSGAASRIQGFLIPTIYNFLLSESKISYYNKSQFVNKSPFANHNVFNVDPFRFMYWLCFYPLD